MTRIDADPPPFPSDCKNHVAPIAMRITPIIRSHLGFMEVVCRCTSQFSMARPDRFVTAPWMPFQLPASPLSLLRLQPDIVQCGGKTQPR